MPASTWVRKLVACALVSAAAAQLEWTAIPYPENAAQHQIQTSPKVKVNGKEASIGYMKFFRPGEKIGGGTAGMVGNKNGLAAANNGGMVYEYDKVTNGIGTKPMISNNPDFSSLLQVEGKLFGVTQFEAPSPGTAYLSQYEQNAKTGAITTTNLKEVDFTTQGGVWTPCAGSVTPWQTHLGSEEYPFDAKKFYSESVVDVKQSWNHESVVNHLRYFGHYDGASNATVTREQAMQLGYYPYQYGYPWETVVKKDFTEKTTKLYAHGRMSYEMAYVMPDSKTVYHTDDGTNCVFTMMKLKKEKELKEGTLFCMKLKQTSPPGQDAITFTADAEWIEMPTPTHAEAEAAIKTTTFQDLFDSESCNADFKCPTAGFISINVGTGCECLKVKAGKEKLASVFEKRRYAAYLGCTAELYRWEGITYDPDSKKAYTALSNVGLGMLGDDGKTPSQGLDPNDQGGPNHIKMKANSCGCVMEMDIDADMKVTKVRMLVCGKKSSAENPKKMGRFTDACDVNNIANPDNVAFIPGAKQLIIGEDTSSHINNLIWIYDFKSSSNTDPSKNLTRIAATPMGSETTSPYWYTIGNWSYMMFVIQHPYEANSVHGADDPQWTMIAPTNPEGRAAWVGAVGPIPKLAAPIVVKASAPRGSAMFGSVICVTLLSAAMALMAVVN